MAELWEILVPCSWNSGRPIRTKHHRRWDERVRAISGGLTIMKPAVGQWVNDDQVYHERMIPVRIACSRAQIETIMDITARHYEQLAVMAYKISDAAIIKHYPEMPQTPRS